MTKLEQKIAQCIRLVTIDLATDQSDYSARDMVAAIARAAVNDATDGSDLADFFRQAHEEGLLEAADASGESLLYFVPVTEFNY